ncbi:MAG TPA: hypothetical protein PKO06_03550 [Candidatus Ozemobacteraceae bacterium]|nr:hypothetical protein [Candidatus Ozemobacteraceae bacterium]
MKKVLCLMLVLCLTLPAMAMAAKGVPSALKAQDTLTADQKATFEGKARVKMGKEFLFVSKDAAKASLKKDDVCTEKRQIHYVCCCQKVTKNRPGKCPCGKGLIPAIKLDNNWYTLDRDELGQLVVKPFVAVDCAAKADCCGGTKADCPSCGKCAPKAEPAPAADAAPAPAPADCGSCGN